MKFRFTQFFLVLGLTTVFASCSKDKDEEISAGISCKIDGTTRRFDVNALALKNDGGGNYSYAIFGSTDATANTAGLAIVVGGDSPITVGTTYTFSEDDDDNQLKMGTITYVPSGSTGDGYISIPGSTTTPTSLTITAISDKSIQGTFKGDVVALIGGTASVKTVTEGKFNVTIMQ